MWPEETVSCCPLGGETPHPMCPSAGVWRPVGTRGHAAAVPCLPLGYSDLSQGLDTVWASVAGDVAGNMGWGAEGLGPKGAGVRAISEEGGKVKGTQWD